MSRRGLEGGRKKSLLDPRRHVKCPVSECKYSGRTDHVKRHFRNLIVWSQTYEGEAIVETLASDKVITFYEKNKHTALGDAETLCRLSNSTGRPPKKE